MATALMPELKLQGTSNCAAIVPPKDAASAALAAVPEVNIIYMARRGMAVHVWVIVSSFDRSVRNKVYAVEQQMLDVCRGTEFDFNVVPDSRELNLQAEISDAVLTYQKK